MTPPINMFAKAKNALFEAYKTDTSKMLLWTGTIGWVLSAAGQIAGIALNKKVSKKEKEFLIPQEIADAAVNITCFFLLTGQVKNIAQKLVKRGKIITPEIMKKCKEFGIPFEKEGTQGKIDIAKAIQDKIRDLKGALNIKEHKNLSTHLSVEQETVIKKRLDDLNDFNNKTYSSFENGVNVIGSLVGSVISGNIITPMLRNPVASWKQKSALDREKMENDARLYQENRVILAQNQAGQSDYKVKTVNPYPTSGSMKI